MANLAAELACGMIAALRKTARRTGQYAKHSLVCREPYRDQVLVVWLLVTGLLWILGGAIDHRCIICLGLSLALAGLLVAICAIDARFGIIPDEFVGAMAALGLLAVWLLDLDEVLNRLAEVVIAAISIMAFRSIYRRFRGYDGFGFGDVKFLAAATFWIGLRSLPALLLIAVVSALASIFLLKSRRDEVDGRHAIPFGPHLAVGLWMVWVFDPIGLRLD